MVFAGWASIVVKFFLPTECGSTARSWAPWSFCLIFLHINIKRKSLKFLPKFSIYKLMHIGCCKFPSTSHGTFNVYFFLINQSLNMIAYAFSMEYMTALQGSHILVWYFFKANLTFYDYILFFLSLLPFIPLLFF